MKRLTPKQRVLRKWPWAYFKGNFIYRNAPGPFLDYTDYRTLGYGPSPKEAWADAAKRLRGRKS